MSYLVGMGALPAGVKSVASSTTASSSPPASRELPWWAWPVGALAIGVIFTIVVHVRES